MADQNEQAMPFANCADEAGVLSEDSSFSSSGASPTAAGPSNWVRRGLLLVGSAIVVACVVAGTQASGSAAPIPARQLFESHALIEAATDSVMKVGKRNGRYAEADRAHVRSQVAGHFQDYGKRMAALSPETERRLQEWQISDDQHHAMANMMRNAGDARVQDIGDQVASALRQSERAHEDVDATKERVRKLLAPRQEEMRQLQDELLGSSASSQVQDKKAWDSILELTKHKQVGDGHGERRLQDVATTTLFDGVLPVLATVAPVTTEGATVAPVFTTAFPEIGLALEPTTTKNIKEEAEALLESCSVMLSSALMMVQMSGNAFRLPQIALNFLTSGNYIIEFAQCLLDHAPLDEPEEEEELTTAAPAAAVDEFGMEITTMAPDMMAQHMGGMEDAMGPMMMMMCPMQLGVLGQKAIGQLLSELGINAHPMFPYTRNISIFDNKTAAWAPATLAPTFSNTR